MYPTSGATIRADLNGVVEEASKADNFFIGHLATPPVMVDAKSGTYPKIEIAGGELLTPDSTIRTRGSAYGEVTRKWTTDTYDCIDRGLKEAIDDTDVKDMGRRFDMEATVSKLLLRNMKTAHEIRSAAVVMNASNFGAGTNSAVAYTEANIATVSFVADVLAAIERVNDQGAQANTIILSSTVLNRIRRATPVVTFVAGQVGQGASVTANSISQAFADNGIERCLVGRARYNSAKKGAAKSLASVWGTTYVWVGYVNPTAAMPEDAGAAATLVWNAEGGLFVTETYRDEDRRSNMIRVRQNTVEKCIDGTAGTLITTQWS